MYSNSIQKRKEITRTWKSGNGSTTLIIPKSIAKDSGLDNPCHVIVELTHDGILLKKLDLE